MDVPIPDGATVAPSDSAEVLYDRDTLLELNGTLEKQLAERDLVIGDLRLRIADYRQEVAANERNYLAISRELSEQKQHVEDAKIEADFERDRAISLQRKLDRSHGYLDRVLDQEDGYEKGELLAVTRPAVGPNFDDIAEARRRRTDGGTMWTAQAGEVRIGSGYTGGRPRRY